MSMLSSFLLFKLTSDMKNILFAIFLLLCIISCTSETEVRTNEVNKILGNGKHLQVNKTTKVTTHTGIITHHNYGTTYRYNYTFTIDDGDINWLIGDGEPKTILFCTDTTYISLLTKKNIAINDTIDSLNINTSYRKVVQQRFQQYIDERFFFNLFGDDYWIDIPAEKYYSKQKNCTEYDIPNDNELTLPTLKSIQTDTLSTP